MSSSEPHRSIPTEDRVSSLPDSIMSQILSFLPTKDSVATSVLSKRWNRLWLSVLDLNFDAQTFKDYITFRHAVYSVIVSRDITLPIRSFRLKFGKEYDINDINRFINAAMQRGIKELDIDMSEMVTGLTGSILSCKTLTVLKLKKLVVKDDNCQVNLPLLKVLYLDPSLFKCPTSVINFFYGCPILEELQTAISSYYLKKLNPETLNLLRTSIPTTDQYIFLYFLRRVEIMRLQMKSHKYIQFPKYCSLIQMEILFFNSNGKSWGEKWKWMLEVLQHNPKLQHLTIHEDMENGIYEDNWKDTEIVPECLSSQLKTCLFTGCRGRKCELQFAEYVMKHSKVLRSMTIRSASSINLNAKLEMLRKLSVSPRGCKLIFD